MKKQTLIWTLLPNGIRASDGALLFSALVTPRLQSSATSPTVSLFPDWVDWPAACRSMRFSLVHSGGRTVPATVVSAAPDSPGWQRLVAAGARVDSWAWKSF